MERTLSILTVAYSGGHWYRVVDDLLVAESIRNHEYA
jgi:hypothetical protein